MMRLPAATALLLIAAAPDKAAPARLGAIRAFLFYESSGTLSNNIASPAVFDGWNTVIGEGEAKDAARDVLVTVPLSLPPRGDMAVDSGAPIVIIARAQDGRTLGSRTITNILVPYRGEVHQALWLRDATCAARVKVTARYGAQIRTATLRLSCGE